MNIKDLFKNLDDSTKKLIKIFGIFIAIIIILLILLGVYRLIFGKKVSYTNLENIIELAGQKYFVKEDKLPKNDGEVNKISSDILITGKYMRSFDKYTKDTNCSANVIVSNNNGTYLYNTILKCDNYKTKTISDAIIDKMVSSGDGVYLNNNEYVYRGERVDNYIKLGDDTYRILEINSLNFLKIYVSKPSLGTHSWDDRYNSEMDNNKGINTFSKSRLKEYFDQEYDDYDDDLKKYIVNYDWCIGGISKDDISAEINSCNEIFKSHVGTINIFDYYKISLDEHCMNIYDDSCENYNYLEIPTVWTINHSNEESDKCYSFAGTAPFIRNCNEKYKILNVFYISGDNNCLSGDGSESNPYLIK